MRRVNMFVIDCKYVGLVHFHILLHISFFIVFNCHHFFVLYDCDGLICSLIMTVIQFIFANKNVFFQSFVLIC